MRQQSQPQPRPTGYRFGEVATPTPNQRLRSQMALLWERRGKTGRRVSDFGEGGVSFPYRFGRRVRENKSLRLALTEEFRELRK